MLFVSIIVEECGPLFYELSYEHRMYVHIVSVMNALICAFFNPTNRTCIPDKCMATSYVINVTL